VTGRRFVHQRVSRVPYGTVRATRSPIAENCSGCGAVPGERCFRTIAGTGEQVPLKGFHKPRKEAVSDGR
jgi:hypothetical protein